ncbi:MAG: RNA polymerase sigma factor [Chloroflexota bacterium]
MPPSEAALIERAQKKDETALLELYERYYASILNYVGYRVFDRECAEDLTADVFVRMVEKIGTYQPGERPFLAWLYTIARNLVIDNHRRQAAVTLLPIEEDLLPGDSHHPGPDCERIFIRESLQRAMGQLTEEQRQVIFLKFIEVRENGDVAALMGKNERAIRSLQHRALAALQRAVGRDGWDAS